MSDSPPRTDQLPAGGEGPLAGPPFLQHSALVLAGGRSERLGGDTATVLLGGRTLLDRMLSLLVGLFEDIVVVGPVGWSGAPAGVRFVEDHFRRPSLLSGLCTGLGVTEHQRTLAVGCDRPFLSAELLQTLIAGDGTAVATVLRTGAQVHPLPAIYDRRVRPVIGPLLAAGEESLLGLLRVIEVRHVDVKPGERSAFSITTPEELRRAEALVRARGPR